MQRILGVGLAIAHDSDASRDTPRCWSVQLCVRPVDAVHMTAGPPRIRSRSQARVRQCDGTNGLSRSPDRPALHYALFALPTFNAFTLTIMAQTIRAILLASAMAATLVGRRANNAVSQGRCLVPWILA